jgi:hypothetical protein
MATMKKLTRRDRCFLVGRRAGKLNYSQAITAWFAFAVRVEEFGEKDVPKFNDILTAMRDATKVAKKEK